MRALVLLTAAVFLIQCSSDKADNRSSQNSRVDSVLAKMTLEEKVGQMTQVTLDMILKEESTTEIDEEKLREAIINKKVGSILNVKQRAYDLDTWHSLLTRIQDVATKETNSGIPILYGIDAIHGTNYTIGATLFPHNIGIAATRNPDLATACTEITAKETRASGIRWNFDPVLGLGRQPLWPRFEETFGEDVTLVATMGAAVINAYEGEDLSQPDRVASCMKHYIGYSIPRTGKDRTPAYIPEYILREYLLPPFRKAVEAGTSTVMVNSGEVNGVPVHASKYLLTDVLREELGFTGLVVSDWEDVIRLHTRHRVADSPKEAVRQSVDAGLDMSMVPLDYSFYDLLLELVKEGKLSEGRIDESVRRILQLKFDLGLFDDPYPEAAAIANFGKPEYRTVSLEAARESLTLLKNDGNVLPLSKNARVLLAGPGAHNMTSLNSSWSFTWQGQDDSYYPKDALTIKEAVEKLVGQNNVICRGSREYEAAVNYDIGQLKKDAGAVDVIVLCLGEKAYAESPGVIDDLTLDSKQLDLANAAIKTGKPVVLVLTEGRPRIITEIESGIPAILHAYRPGTMGGQAIADVLYGDYNPNGILPFTYPRFVNDLVLYDHKYSERIREDVPDVYGSRGFNPLFDFGHGLSYTTFEYSDLAVSPATFKAGEELSVAVNVKNTGNRAGKVAVELYAKDLYASITPPFRRLKKFTKVSLEPGESKTVNFSLTPEDLSFINEEGERVTEPGDFEMQINDLSTTVRFQ